MKAAGIFYGTVLCGVVSDLLSKWLIFKGFKDAGYINILSGFLGIICSMNEGVVFGLLQGKGNALVYFTIFAIGLIAWIYYHSDKSSMVNTIGLGVILSGAIGNLWDRIIYHAVRDFIDIHIGRCHWPTFNIADLLICSGVGLLIFKTFKAGRR